MGKYIRKSSRGGGAAPAVVVAGVRTRSRSAALSSAPAPTRANVEVDKGRHEDGGGAAEGCCYLQLRSRRLFMIAAEVKSSAPVAEAEEGEEASPAVPLAITASTASVEVSRCSSTASSVDAAAVRSRNDCAAETREDCGEESSAASDSGSPCRAIRMLLRSHSLLPRYNLDVVRGVPLDAGGRRFEWTPVANG